MTPGTKGRIVAAIALPLFVLHAQAAHCQPAAPSASVASAEMRMDHISIVRMGKGSPIVLIPGLASPRAVWDGVAPALAKTHTVILVQVNGFAGDAPGANLKPGVLDGIVADVSAYIAREKLGATAVIGHSMGGLAGLMLAKAHPEQVSKLMIVDSLPFFGVLFGPGVTVDALKPQAAAMRDKAAATYADPAARQAGAVKVAQQMASKPDAQAKVTAWAAAADPRVSGEALYEDLTTDLRPDMKAIQTPITLVYPWNATGPTKPMADALYRAAYADAPHVTFVDVGDAAHFVMLDQPAAFAAAVEAFAG